MMEWNVYLEDVKRGEIKKFNVFDHVSFAQEVQKLLKKLFDNKEFFSIELERSARYYFGWKSEYEIVLTSWPPYITTAEVERIKSEETPKYRTTYEPEVGKKIDIAQQLILNWDRFVDYCWSFRPAEKPIQKVRVRKVNK